MRKVLRFILVIWVVFTSHSSFAQGSLDSQSAQQMRINTLEEAITRLESTVSTQGKKLKALESTLSVQSQQLETLSDELDSVAETVSTTGALLDEKIDSNTRSLLSDNSLIKIGLSRTRIVGLVAIVLLIAILGLVFALLRRRIKASSTEVRALKSDIDVLNERIISSDQSLLDFIKQQESAVLNTTQEKADHSLALKIADEVVRIENNLSRMDPSVRGYKQLSAALRRIKDNFAANGYELVDMLGKPYKEGMKVIANFVTDENLEEGQQIITSIIKPQINYDGVMIQAAQVTVSQNV